MLKDAFRELSNEIILEWQGGRISKISTQYTNHDFNSPIFFLRNRSLFISWSDCRVLVVSWEKYTWFPPLRLCDILMSPSSLLAVIASRFFTVSPPPSNLLVKTNPHFFPPKNYVIPPPIPPFSRYLLTAPLTLKSHFFQQELRLNLQDQEVNV